MKCVLQTFLAQILERAGPNLVVLELNDPAIVNTIDSISLNAVARKYELNVYQLRLAASVKCNTLQEDV